MSRLEAHMCEAGGFGYSLPLMVIRNKTALEKAQISEQTAFPGWGCMCVGCWTGEVR